MKIWVRVRPQAKRDELKKTAEGEFTVWLRAPAREGKANEALVGLVADYFSVPKSSVAILQGRTSRRKLLEILRA